VKVSSATPAGCPSAFSKRQLHAIASCPPCCPGLGTVR
jgi:hypothetical protein